MIEIQELQDLGREFNGISADHLIELMLIREIRELNRLLYNKFEAREQ